MPHLGLSPHVYLDEGTVANLGIQGPDMGGQVHVQEQVVLAGRASQRGAALGPCPRPPSVQARPLTFISSSIFRHEAYLDS